MKFTLSYKRSLENLCERYDAYIYLDAAPEKIVKVSNEYINYIIVYSSPRTEIKAYNCYGPVITYESKRKILINYDLLPAGMDLLDADDLYYYFKLLFLNKVHSKNKPVYKITFDELMEG